MSTPLTWSLKLADKISGPARGAAASLDKVERKLKLVDGTARRSSQTQEALARRRSAAERRLSSATELESTRRRRVARAEAGDLDRLARQVTRTQEREFQRRQQIAVRAGQALARTQAQQARTQARLASTAARTSARASTRRGTEARQGLAAAGAAGVAGLSTVLMAVDAYASNVQQRSTDRQSLESGTSRLASGAGLQGGTVAERAAQLSSAVRGTAAETGIAPTEVLEGLRVAQGRFAFLATAGGRATYLRDVLPELARVALATQTPLARVIETAGEMQRQMNIAPDALPDALAQVVIQGQRGSIEFADMAQHIGGLYGMTGRFMATTGAAGRRSNALTGALFQTAGNAGQGGDASATMVRGFLANFSSARGQGRLRGVLGENALDARGQMRTAAGQTQTDAFMRMIESVYARTGGNAERFGHAIAGDDQQGRVLADQLFRELGAGGGRLTGFRTLVEGASGATADNTQGAASRAAQGTSEVQRARSEVDSFYRLTEGPFAAAVEQVRLRTAEVARDWGAFSFLYDNALVRALTTSQEYGSTLEDQAFAGTRRQGPATTRRDLLRDAAQADATAEIRGEATPLDRRDLANITRMVNERTERNLQTRLERDRARGIDPNTPVRLASETITALGAAFRGAQPPGAAPGAVGGVPGGAGLGGTP